MLAIIGGTGFGELAGVESPVLEAVDTPWGEANVQRGTLGGAPVLFIARHGFPPSIPPHRINYRANIHALTALGAAAVASVNAVGSVDRSLPVPALVVPDQIIDYTWGRAHTFYSDEIHHIDFTYPYDATLRLKLLELAREVEGAVLHDGGVYGCAQGPRLETAAEIRRMAADGCRVVGMTGMPEAALAREADLPYASLSVVVNAGAGLHGEVDLAGIEAAMMEGMGWVAQIVREAARHYT